MLWNNFSQEHGLGFASFVNLGSLLVENMPEGDIVVAKYR